MATKKPEWIDLDTKDPEHNLRDWYVMATVLEGADSIQKIMAVTYLSQFEDLEGEFATRPVFTPDFQVGIIPYSSNLLEIYNDIAHRAKLDSVGDGQDLNVILATNTQANIDHFVMEGAQLSRLYQQNRKNLEKFEDDKQELFKKVNKLYHRDQNLIRNLTYLTDSLIAQPEEN